MLKQEKKEIDAVTIIGLGIGALGAYQGARAIAKDVKQALTKDK